MIWVLNLEEEGSEWGYIYRWENRERERERIENEIEWWERERERGNNLNDGIMAFAVMPPK